MSAIAIQAIESPPSFPALVIRLSMKNVFTSWSAQLSPISVAATAGAPQDVPYHGSFCSLQVLCWVRKRESISREAFAHVMRE